MMGVVHQWWRKEAKYLKSEFPFSGRDLNLISLKQKARPWCRREGMNSVVECCIIFLSCFFRIYINLLLCISHWSHSRETLAQKTFLWTNWTLLLFLLQNHNFSEFWGHKENWSYLYTLQYRTTERRRPWGRFFNRRTCVGASLPRIGQLWLPFIEWWYCMALVVILVLLTG